MVNMSADGARIRPWPLPLLFSPIDPMCGCAFSYTPDVGGISTPWVLKFAWGMCLAHRNWTVR